MTRRQRGISGQATRRSSRLWAAAAWRAAAAWLAAAAPRTARTASTSRRRGARRRPGRGSCTCRVHTKRAYTHISYNLYNFTLCEVCLHMTGKVMLLRAGQTQLLPKEAVPPLHKYEQCRHGSRHRRAGQGRSAAVSSSPSGQTSQKKRPPLARSDMQGRRGPCRPVRRCHVRLAHRAELS